MKQVNLEFKVLESQDPRYLFIMDLSEWSHIESKPAIVEIVVAGYTEPVVYNWDKKSMNVFNSLNLMQGCDTCGDDLQNLPDGIYTITIKGSPDTYNYTTKYLKVDSLNLQIAELLIKHVGTEYSVEEDVKEKVLEINFLKEAAKANIFFDNIDRANELMNIAYSTLDRLKNCYE